MGKAGLQFKARSNCRFDGSSGSCLHPGYAKFIPRFTHETVVHKDQQHEAEHSRDEAEGVSLAIRQ